MDTRLSGPRMLVGPLLLLVAVAGLWSGLVRQPLWHTDLWGHLAYGRWMVEHDGQTPSNEPFLPHATGEALVDTARWSQLIGFRIMSAGGGEALQLLYATLVTGCALLAVMPVLASRRGRRIPSAVCGAAIFLAVGWQQLQIIRPQLAGLACFTLLSALMHDPRPSRRRVILVGIVLGLWANLHGSFVIGWLLVVLHVIGRVIDCRHRTGRWRSDRQLAHRFRQAIVGLLVPLVATPYGVTLPWSAWQIGQHPNLADIVEWQPLAWGQIQARAMLAAVILILALALASRRRIRTPAWLMLATTGVATLVCSRWINWWAPMAGSVVAFQASGLGHQVRTASTFSTRQKGQLAGCGVIVATLAIISSPAARGLLTHRDTLVARRPLVSASTPVEATAWLVSHPPRGMVLAAYEWGDFLIWQGPPQIQLMVASHTHLIPESVWRDYIEVIGVSRDWPQRLERQQVHTLVLDRHRQAGLIAALANHPLWKKNYSDDLAEVWSRKQ